MTAACNPVVIILNGVSSVGKSSIAKALQQTATRPMLHVALDDFLGMLPARSFDTPGGLTFKTLEADGAPSTEVIAGKIVERALRGMRRAVAALARAGNDLIVDDVMFGVGEDDDYYALMPDCTVRLVGIIAPLCVIEERERVRGDRTLGLARWQFGRVHLGRRYDMQLDTASTSVEDCARLIRDAYDL